MQEKFREKYDELPRPKSLIPGPPATWAELEPHERIVTIEMLTQELSALNEKNHLKSELSNTSDSDFELPNVALGNLGDNDLSSKPSAVLVPFKTADDNKTIESVIVMTRTMTVSLHKGQVSFPGGMVEPTDESLEHTALRETHEEIGINPNRFSILGRSNPVATRNKNSRITPIVATFESTALDEAVTNDDEVAQLHEIKIAELLKPDNYFCEIWDFGEMAVPIHMYFVADTQDNNVFIWGATANIMTELLHCSTKGSLK